MREITMRESDAEPGDAPSVDIDEATPSSANADADTMQHKWPCVIPPEDPL